MLIFIVVLKLYISYVSFDSVNNLPQLFFQLYSFCTVFNLLFNLLVKRLYFNFKQFVLTKLLFFLLRELYKCTTDLCKQWIFVPDICGSLYLLSIHLLF